MKALKALKDKSFSFNINFYTNWKDFHLYLFLEHKQEVSPFRRLKNFNIYKANLHSGLLAMCLLLKFLRFNAVNVKILVQ